MTVVRQTRPEPTFARRLKWRVKRVIKRLLKPQRPRLLSASDKVRYQWSIGIYRGYSPLELGPANRSKPVLTADDVTDVYASFVADPFMIQVNRVWYMFFEVMNAQTHRGEIGLATSRNGLKWRYQQIVLFEPFHLSYPYVFEWMGSHYLIPETGALGSVRLYRAGTFPSEWMFVTNLLEGHTFSDASVFRHGNQWWLMVETNPQLKSDTLRLYCADDLHGPWSEHPASPLIQGNCHIARPGGRVIVTSGKLVRYAQDCAPYYGSQVHAFEVTELSSATYEERPIGDKPVLTGSGRGWNAMGMHHVDAHQLPDGQWLAAVDGWTNW
jgi:hypothetical protein